MTQNIGEFATRRKRRFDWAAILPKRAAWLQSLVLLPFGLPVASFLGTSWNFSVNSIVEGQQYPLAICSMAFNVGLASLFMSFIFHWGWFLWKQSAPTWYPNRRSFWAGAYGILTISTSFAIVELFNRNVGVCGNGGWGDIGANLFCNLNGYGFESKSWFGVWFIVAAYCYQSQPALKSLYHRFFPQPVHHDDLLIEGEDRDLAADDFGSHHPDSIATGSEE